MLVVDAMPLGANARYVVAIRVGIGWLAADGILNSLYYRVPFFVFRASFVRVSCLRHAVHHFFLIIFLSLSILPIFSGISFCDGIVDLQKKWEVWLSNPNFPNFHVPKFGNGQVPRGRMNAWGIVVFVLESVEHFPHFPNFPNFQTSQNLEMVEVAVYRFLNFGKFGKLESLESLGNMLTCRSIISPGIAGLAAAVKATD